MEDEKLPIPDVFERWGDVADAMWRKITGRGLYQETEWQDTLPEDKDEA